MTNICTYPWNAQHDAGKLVAEGTAERVAQYPEWEKEIRMYYGEFEKMLGGQVAGMEDYIKELKGRGFRILGLSNWSEETFAMIRQNYPILDLIEDMVISGKVKVMKPAAEIYRIALQCFGIKPEESVFIDDNVNNINGCEAVGIHGIVFENVEQLKMDLEKLL